MEVKNLDLDDKQLQLLKNILKEKVDSKTVWAYGSRIDGTSDKKSDLDLVIFDITTKDLLNLKEVLEESDLLVSVDLFQWHKIPDYFQTNIKQKYLVIQS